MVNDYKILSSDWSILFRSDAEVIPSKRRSILTPGESPKTVDNDERSPEDDSVSEDVMKRSKTGVWSLLIGQH